MRDADLILVGGGLANSLIALAVAARDPARRILLVDAGAQAGGHTWSFHQTDLNDRQRQWLAPAIACAWPGQEVRFSRYARRLRTGYASLTSASLAAALAACPSVIRIPARAERISAKRVHIDGQAWRAPCVIDGTGRIPEAYMALGWQVFVGVELDCAAPHGRDVPIIMDAQVAQNDGYRFVYTLPFTDRRILIEDTRYTDGSVLDEADCLAAIHDYAAKRGWEGAEARRERGVLPVVMAFDAAAFWADAAGGAVPVGMRAGLFHPVTGYSLPLAARVADVAAAHACDTREAFAAVRRFALQEARRQTYSRFLSRLLFRAAEPEQRRRILEHFYRLSEPLIERFYAGRLTLADRARILIGKPPVPIPRALACLSERPLLKAARRKRLGEEALLGANAEGV
ncbi:lycopene beta-cyclase [Rhodoblastus acidophilus]|uniref:Lycopene beta-cyclase n=1 Tax=Rhodoblastus acidophilus TaxID=1074 RepID=A0A212R977_RHOAC|nr:lycopene beta-cyclase CrtY [Rhodoblastus acidophilus]MCW2317362.1 lycopene beta-cyclase [Rhodoblastus acidophilus]PPQ39269.1 lycopene cyclase [Rhodoblastus acidophilus]RAI24006.1 lycopene cyclase [Rhodoblastus acidophilus]SNB68710.1 lycopene beta-cyclase [Rhodoblastus acidophilus]